ncbi:hypothetical protein HKBW3S44_01974, partial [Candidatus Hakubella thermalkaliphila]
MLSDTPRVGHEISDLVRGKYEEPGSTSVAPFYGDQNDHPRLFGGALYGESDALGVGGGGGGA